MLDFDVVGDLHLERERVLQVESNLLSAVNCPRECPHVRVRIKPVERSALSLLHKRAEGIQISR